jgi:hypothetical protein
MSQKQTESKPTELKLDDMKKVVGGAGRYGYYGYGQNNQGNDNSQGNEPSTRRKIVPTYY